MACLDTTVLLDAMGRGGRNLKQRADARIGAVIAAGEALFATRFSLAELYVGVFRAADPANELDRVRRILNGLGILEFDGNAAWEFGRATAFLQRIGRPTGVVDVLIAATVMASGEYLITRNASHFKDIPGLKIEEY